MPLLVYSITLLFAVLLSGLARRSVLSLAVLFLAAGFVAGPGVLGVIAVKPSDPLVVKLVELALFTSLFTGGMLAPYRLVRRAWSLPGRALLLGLPITLVAIALLAYWLVGLPWLDALLIGAVLSPTDPVFAAAVVGRNEVPLGSGPCSTWKVGSTAGWCCPSWSCSCGRSLALNVPPSTQDGRVFRLRGQGMPHLGAGRGERGDLYAEVHVNLPEHPTQRQRELLEELARLEHGAAGTGAGA